MTDWQCHLLSCPGQLKKGEKKLLIITTAGPVSGTIVEVYVFRKQRSQRQIHKVCTEAMKFVQAIFQSFCRRQMLQAAICCHSEVGFKMLENQSSLPGSSAGGVGLVVGILSAAFVFGLIFILVLFLLCRRRWLLGILLNVYFIRVSRH